MASSIIHRLTRDSFGALMWADNAAGLGWRVVSIVNSAEGWHVFAEAPEDADPDDWDAALAATERSATDGE